jgi:hypothetical protein
MGGPQIVRDQPDALYDGLGNSALLGVNEPYSELPIILYGRHGDHLFERKSKAR